MQGIWIVVGVIAFVMVAIPIAAIALVSVASLYEESARSLSGQAPGWIARVARRVLAYQTGLPGGIGGPARQRAPAGPADGPLARRTGPAAGQEVRFAYARRTLPDVGQLSAIR